MYSNDRIVKIGNPLKGNVKISFPKFVWVVSHLSIAIIGGIWTFSMDSLILFMLFTGFTLCFGHSLGMHRLFIHKSYQCPKLMEYFFVHLGVLVGLAGPFGMIRTHDMRDWAQRQPKCHPYFSHDEKVLKDAYWQLVCDLHMDNPPSIHIENNYASDPVYQWMEKYWMWQQLPWAILFILLGGIDWLVWGISARVSVSILGHWLIGYFAHNQGHKTWHVKGAAVQGHNIPFCGLITMGECWHNNHHAFPGSAKLGLERGQFDPGWWVLKVLEKLGVVSDLILPADLPHRPELKHFKPDDSLSGTCQEKYP